MTSSRPQFLIAVILLTVSGSCQAYAADTAGPPVVSRVEPPNWWVGDSVNPVRLLIYGSRLQSAHITADGGLVCGSARVTDQGRYAFVDVRLSPSASIGTHLLSVRTAGGTTTVPFEVDPRSPAGQLGRRGMSPDLSAATSTKGLGEDDVVYLIMPDRFADGDPTNDNPAVAPGLYSRSNSGLYHGGDLQGVIDHLGYLKDLGVTAIWLTPIYENYHNPNNGETALDKAHADYHGYSSINDYGVEPHLGTPATLHELIRRAHAMGIKIIQDQVENHTSRFHPWVADPPTPTWYHGTTSQHPNNNFQVWELTDPHATAGVRESALNGWFLNFLPDLNQDDPEEARYQIQNSIWWVKEFGFDGVRLDAFPFVPRSFWGRETTVLKNDIPGISFVGEVFDGDAATVSYFQGGRAEEGIDTGIQSVFDYPLYFQIRKVFAQGGSFLDLSKGLAHDYLYPAPDKLVTFLGDHDVPRFMSESGADATGLKLAYTFLLTTRGIPCLYYGDEIGMPGAADPDNRRDFPGGFPGDTRTAFTGAGRTPQESDIFEHVRALLHLRASTASLRRGDLRELYVADKQYVYSRTLGGQTSVVAFNASDAPRTIRVEIPGRHLAAGMWPDRLGSDAVAAVDPSGGTTVTIPAGSGAVFKLSP